MTNMEALRLEGNKLFSTQPGKAAEYYEEAMRLYEENCRKVQSDGDSTETVGTLEEYSKCAGNALTSLFQAKEFERCEALARRALMVNPILAKANAFLGKVLLQSCREIASIDNNKNGSAIPQKSTSLRVGETPFMFLCRAIYQLPALQPTLQASLQDAVEKMLSSKRRHQQQDIEEVEVGVEQSDLGNGVVARSSIPAGTALVDLSHPFSIGVYEESEGKGSCIHCGQGLLNVSEGEQGTAVSKCEVCDSVAYCSASCNTAHKTQHARECGPLRKLKTMMQSIDDRRIAVPENFFELAYHAITTVAALRTSQPGSDRLLKLESHAQEVAQHTHPTVDLVYELLDGKEEKGLLAEVIGIIKCNAMEIVDSSSGQGVAQGLHVNNIASLFNHCCLPNCSIDVARGLIVTTRDVMEGESLCIAYIPQLYWPTRLRQEALQEQYFFSCRCVRCMQDEPASKSKKNGSSESCRDPFEKSLTMELPNRPSLLQSSSATDHFHPIVQAACYKIRSMDVDQLTTTMISDTEKLLREVEKHLFPFHYLCHELRNTLSFLYTAFGRYEDCFLSCVEELLLWETILPGALPVKQMKLSNAIQCLEELAFREKDQQESLTTEKMMNKTVLGKYLYQLACLYDVREESATDA